MNETMVSFIPGNVHVPAPAWPDRTSPAAGAAPAFGLQRGQAPTHSRCGVEHFNYYGIAKTTMHDIAAAAGVAVGTLYLYFRNKDDLLVGCMENFIAEHQAMAEALLATREPAAKKLRYYLLERFRVSENLRVGSRHAAEIARAVSRSGPNEARKKAS